MLQISATTTQPVSSPLRNILTFRRTRAHVRSFAASAYAPALAWFFAALAAFVVQGWIRGKMDEVGAPVRGAGLEEMLFFGSIPSASLQDLLYTRFPDAVGWFSVIVHGSWFPVPWLTMLAVAFVAPHRMKSLIVAVVCMFALVLPIFALIPMAPPWMAVDGVVRVIPTHLDREITDINQVAAMPSMHIALPMLIALWFWGEGFKKGAVMMLGYAALVGFEVVLSGEHYVVDIIGAVVFAAVVLRIATYVERRMTGSASDTKTDARLLPVRGETGQNLLEFALLAPFVLIFIGAIVTFGLGMNTRSSLQQAVREGARQAAVGRSLTEVQDLAAGNAPENLDPADIAWCHPVDTDGTQGQLGDPVRVFIEGGYDFTIISSNGILGVTGLGNLSVTLNPVATARLEKSVASPEDC